MKTSETEFDWQSLVDIDSDVSEYIELLNRFMYIIF